MGNLVGYIPQSGFKLYFSPDVNPHPLEETTFDPSFGFPKGRQERIFTTTEDELYSAKIPLEDRDYCVEYLLRFRACRKDMWPWVVRCKHEKHEYLNCKYDDFVLRMKEYERERRLRIREKATGGVC